MRFFDPMFKDSLILIRELPELNEKYRNESYKSPYSHRIINLHNCRITELICKYIQMIFTNYRSDKIISCYVDQQCLSKFEMKKLSHRPFLKL